MRKKQEEKKRHLEHPGSSFFSRFT